MGPGEQALLQACKKGEAAFAKQLLQTGVDIECRDAHGKTPLLRAAKYGNLDVVKLLLSNQADITALSKDGRNCLHMAAANGHEAVLQCIVSYGAQGLMDQYDVTGKRPLDVAPRKNRPRIIEIFSAGSANKKQAASYQAELYQRMATFPGHQETAPQDARKSLDDNSNGGGIYRTRSLSTHHMNGGDANGAYRSMSMAHPNVFPDPRCGPYGSMPSGPMGGPAPPSYGGPRPMFSGWKGPPGAAAPNGGAATWRCHSLNNNRDAPRPVMLPKALAYAPPTTGYPAPKVGSEGGGTWKTFSLPQANGLPQGVVPRKPHKTVAQWTAAINQLDTALELGRDVINRADTVKVNSNKCKMLCQKINKMLVALERLRSSLAATVPEVPEEVVPATTRGLRSVFEMLEASNILMVEWSACNSCDFSALIMALQKKDFSEDFQGVEKRIADAEGKIQPAFESANILLGRVPKFEKEMKQADIDDRNTLLTAVFKIVSESSATCEGITLEKLIEKNSMSLSAMRDCCKTHQIGPLELFDEMVKVDDASDSASTDSKSSDNEDESKWDSMKC